MTLKAALAALERGEHGAARDALVAEWRMRRAPAIAELVAVLDQHVPDALSAQLAAIVTPRVASSLANLKALAKVDDPRLAGWAIDALVRLPFTAVTARDFLVEVAKTAARHTDPRFAIRAPEIEEALTTRIGRLAVRTELQAIVAKAIARIPKVAAVDTKKLAALVEPLQRGAHSADVLLAEIYAHPADDAPRLVYADGLQEQGDPRGEFIVLQMRRGADEPSAREVELLKLHGKAWLGDLAPVLAWGKGYTKTTFRRGFVSNADIILSVGKKLQPILTHRAWATVETFDGLYSDRSKLLVHAPLRALHTLDVKLEWLPELATRAEPLTAVTRISLPYWQAVDRAALRAAFPCVQSAVVSCNAITMALVEQFTGLGIEHVELWDSTDQPATALVEQLVGTPARVARLTLKGSFTYELQRDAAGCYALTTV